MTANEIEGVVFETLRSFCNQQGIDAEINANTALIGASKIMDSIGLVNFIVDVETNLLDAGVEISLTSEAAMSSRISPFRSVGALCAFINKQLEAGVNE